MTTASHNADSMKLESKLFDRLRVKPDKNRLLRDASPKCDWDSCEEPGLYPAPKGRSREGQYHRYCLDHVREYNKGYNYFSGMPDEDVVKQQKEDATGNRPTWFVGVNSSARNRTRRSKPAGSGYRFKTDDPFRLFGEGAPGGKRPGETPSRPLKRLERKAFRQLNLEDKASKADIKARFKELVMRLHPDHNDGDRSSEDKLREVIRAYNYLKQAGLA